MKGKRAKFSWGQIVIIKASTQPIRIASVDYHHSVLGWGYRIVGEGKNLRWERDLRRQTARERGDRRPKR